MLSLKEKLVLIQGIKEALPTLEKKPRDHVEKILEGRQLTELRELELKEVYDVCLNPEKYYPKVDKWPETSLRGKIEEKMSKRKPPRRTVKAEWDLITKPPSLKEVNVKRTRIINSK